MQGPNRNPEIFATDSPGHALEFIFCQLSSMSLLKALLSFLVTVAFRIGNRLGGSAPNGRLTSVGFFLFRILVIFENSHPHGCEVVSPSKF